MLRRHESCFTVEEPVDLHSWRRALLACVVLPTLVGAAAHAEVGDLVNTLRPPDLSYSFFGEKVDMESGCGLVGARDEAGRGAAYLLYERVRLVPDDPRDLHAFGADVAIRDGLAVVTATGDDANGPFSGAAYVFDTDGTQLRKFVPDDGAAADLFGVSVALSGTIALIGAQLDDDVAENAGSAYLFDIATGQQIRKLTAPDGGEGDYFGFAVALSDSLAVIGAPRHDALGDDSGAVYVFDAANGDFLFKLLPEDIPVVDPASGDAFGFSVAISGARIVVGSPQDELGGIVAGSAYVFDAIKGLEVDRLFPEFGISGGDRFGESVAADGNRALVGMPFGDQPDGRTDVGVVYVFNLDTGRAITTLTDDEYGPRFSSGDRLGNAVAMSGGQGLAGAPGDSFDGDSSGAAYSFSINGPQYAQKFVLPGGAGGTEFGRAVSLYEGVVAVGAPGYGQNQTPPVRLLDVTDGALVSELTPVAIETSFGSSLALNADYAVVGAPGSSVDGGGGVAYLFDRATGVRLDTLGPGYGEGIGQQIGAAVAIGCERIVVGAPGESPSQGENGGRARLHRAPSGSYNGQLTPQSRTFLDDFGRSVSVSGARALVGSPRYTSNRGAAYLFDLSDNRQIAKLDPIATNTVKLFGTSVWIDERYALVGAPRDDASGADRAGAAYLFDAATGEFLARFTASDAEINDEFGAAVAMHGNVAIIGAPGEDTHGEDAGAAYLIGVDGIGEFAKLLPDVDSASGRFGGAVGVDANYAVVGADGDDAHGEDAGAVYVFQVVDEVGPPPPVFVPCDSSFVGNIFGQVEYLGDVIDLEEGFPAPSPIFTSSNAILESGGTIVDGAVVVTTLLARFEATFEGAEMFLDFEETGFLNAKATGEGEVAVSVGFPFIFRVPRDGYFVASETFAFDAFGNGASIDGSFLTAGDYTLTVSSPFASMPAPGTSYSRTTTEYFALLDSCPGDVVDPIGQVDFADLLALLSAWGTDGVGANFAAPFDTVGFADLLVVIREWGPCS